MKAARLLQTGYGSAKEMFATNPGIRIVKISRSTRISDTYTTMSRPDPCGRLIMPALRIDKVGVSAVREDALRLVDDLAPAGFIIFGGDAEDVARLSAELQQASPHRLLLAADLERGAGQQFRGLSRIPTPMAIAACANAEALACLAGRVTAAEAMSVGINLVFAPLVDVNIEPGNPIINVRAFSDDAETVGRLATQWVHGAQAVGVAACAKHFPGHGGTETDSHIELPEGPRDLEQLRTVHLAPFRAVIAAGVRAIMVAHMTVPAVDDSGLPATLSHRVVFDILRGELGFQGLVITDALIMEGVYRPEPEAALMAVHAGNDILLYPRDPRVVRDALVAAGVDPAAAIARQEASFGMDVIERIAAGCITLIRGTITPPRRFRIVRDDDRLDPEPFRAAALAAGLVEENRDSETSGEDLVCAVFAMPGAWRGRCGPSEESLAAVPTGSGVVAFGDPYWLDRVIAPYVLAAYDDHPRTQALVVEALLGRLKPGGRLPLGGRA